MALQLLSLILLAPLALAVALPALTDLALWLRGLGRASWLPLGSQRPAPLLFLVPAHDEELLIGRTVRSLCEQSYPVELRRVVVIADNCTDATAQVAREAGAMVLSRHDVELRGKHHAIGWALEQLQWQDYEAIVIIDADTIVEPDYAAQLSRWPDLTHRAIQTYDHLSNEAENALTRLAGLLGRIRYDLALPLKARAGLSVPMTGDGIVLGREVLRQHPWRIRTITEGWELYTRLTLAGLTVSYEPRSRLYAQEARSLDQSRSQRERWTAGRLDVLRHHWKEIVTGPGVAWLQRLDLFAELLSVGPVVRATAGLTGCLVALALGTSWGGALAALFATGFLQPISYSGLVLVHHPERVATLRALLYLPRYAAWRTSVAVGGLASAPGRRLWTRTKRKVEPPQ